MSVIKSKRTTSDAQFLNTARELERKTRQACLHAPKRYTFFGIQEFYLTSRKIHSCVKRANTINPTNKNDASERRKLFIEAMCWLQDYVSQLELLIEDGIFTPSQDENLPDLVDLEARLIKGTMKSDRERFKNLPEQ